MDNRAQIREFLASRRARINPEQAGLPAYGGNRRVTGLRREEVAMLAGVSIDYYVRMERGSLAGASNAVLEGLARALQLDEAERDHLFDLARVSEPRPARLRRSREPGVTASVQQVLDAITGAPAWVRNARHDMLAANRLARALYAPLLAGPRPPANNARFVYLDPARAGWSMARARRPGGVTCSCPCPGRGRLKCWPGNWTGTRWVTRGSRAMCAVMLTACRRPRSGRLPSPVSRLSGSAAWPARWRPGARWPRSAGRCGAPGVVQLSTGAWYDPDPRDPSFCRHGNPNVLTADRPSSALSQGTTGQLAMIEIEPCDATPPGVSVHGPPRTAEPSNDDDLAEPG